MQEKKWLRYEKVATSLLDRFASEFGLFCVEGKQPVTGQSGTSWAIDAKGVRSDGEGFFVVEVRRNTPRRLTQEDVAAIAFRISDTGATGGIIVSPLGLQDGAKKVAASGNIIAVQLDCNSSTENYLVRFLERVMLGADVDSIQASAPTAFSGTLTKGP